MYCMSGEPLDQYLSDRILNQIRVFGQTGFNSSRQLDALVHKLVNVEKITHFPFNWPSNTTPQGISLHLRTASLNCHPLHIRRIQWPSLETLFVGERDVPGAPIGPQLTYFDDSKAKLTQITFPMLKSLYINSDHPLQWLSNVSAPRLTMLFIQWVHESDIELPNDLIFSPFPSIENIQFRTTCDDEEIISLLKLMPNVTVANISPMSTRSDFGLGLLRSLTETENDSLLCPKLNNLTLGFPPQRVHTPKVTLEPEIKRLIEMEKRTISSLQVHWSTSSGSQQYGSISPCTCPFCPPVSSISDNPSSRDDGMAS
ncbi:hypothetical protein CPB86DRAFT_426763 [Serendipita vermifera]|nr:hypothetical protein CPB86DRAFT_426763 [Serendipita vermifera]